jgi:flavodoxin
MKSIIIYCSKTGTTDRVAQAVQRGLGGSADMLRLDLNSIGLQQIWCPHFTIDLAAYDLIFLGGWTMVMRAHPFMACYIRECESLENKTIAGFFTGAAPFSRSHVRADFEALLERRGGDLFDFHYTTTLFGLSLTQAKLRRAEEFARRVCAAHQRTGRTG